MKLVVAISGASGVVYAHHFLRSISKIKDIEVYLIISDWAKEIMKQECGINYKELKKIVKAIYDSKDMTAPIASSSFLVDAMVIIPCSIKTASEIANASCNTLISRAADNILKMRKKLIVCVRETPLSTPALEQLYKLSLIGAVVMPLSPAFYHKPKSIEDMFCFITGKIKDLLEIKNNEFTRWGSEL
ncbi:MAG: UbiX family flavin prenyltransferase [Candidatus Diapherotrites archaeon]|nr:UbiX family flavin prenyltransferase [Candidatus Diapherotrites archaeon]